MLATFPGITKNQIMNFLLGHSDIVCVWASFFATVGSVRSLMDILFEQALIRIPIQKSAHQIVHGQRYKVFLVREMPETFWNLLTIVKALVPAGRELQYTLSKAVNFLRLEASVF